MSAVVQSFDPRTGEPYGDPIPPTTDAELAEILREAAALADAGGLRPLLDPQRFSLETVAEAHAAVENGTALGKVVIDIDH